MTHPLVRAQARRKREVCEKSTFLSLCLAKEVVGVFLSVVKIIRYFNYMCIPSPSISQDNQEYTELLLYMHTLKPLWTLSILLCFLVCTAYFYTM
jgi:hypothetical protein